MKLRLGGLAVIAMAALALSACGGSDDPAGQPAAANGMQAYQDCLRKQGITLPSNQARPTNFPTARPTNFPTVRPSGTANPRGGGGFPGGFQGGFGMPSGVDAAKWEAAQKECASVRPSGGPGFNRGGQNGGPGGGLNAAYRNCLTEHGVAFTQGQQLSTADPKVVEAMKVCAPLRPSSTPSN
ncbi:hypothetical protein F4553_004252 [Allocatelliglobosispora scoriae]|uniref:Uncharacterized protein n=1 Tax=Allocatelliglobosispora scoriae TaxID=643052 RepID=A0A841BVD1_9ACTN|nr:hypothetical protein [Allocatelliglobosispora scoriae]MBB5870873.1 hypothetical protein [Allocatelliglobosispora scoriae]